MRIRGVHVARAAVGVVLFGSTALPVIGPLQNGNFNGNLNGWNTAGYAAAVGTQGIVVPVGGSFQALVASGGDSCPTDNYNNLVGKPRVAGKPVSGSSHTPPARTGVKPKYTCGSVNVNDVPEATLEADLGLPAGAIIAALPNNYTPGTDGSAIWQTFYVSGPTTLTFNWAFASNEEIPTQWDAALYSFQSGSNQAHVYELADTTQTNVITANNDTSSPTFYDTSSYRSVSIPISAAGTYTIGFISMQTGDTDVSSGTYISNVQVGGTVSTTPVPPTWGLALIGMLLMSVYFGWRRFMETRSIQS